jgi:hypothetical protein
VFAVLDKYYLALDFYQYFYILTEFALLYVKRLCFMLEVCIPKKENGMALKFEICIFFITIGDCQYG